MKDKKYCYAQARHDVWGLVWCDKKPGHKGHHRRKLPEGVTLGWLQAAPTEEDA